MMNGNESSSTAKRYWAGNLIQLAREIVNSPSIEPANQEFSFLLDQESAHKNLCVLGWLLSELPRIALVVLSRTKKEREATINPFEQQPIDTYLDFRRWKQGSSERLHLFYNYLMLAVVQIRRAKEAKAGRRCAAEPV